jgi:hypothetical protein
VSVRLIIEGTAIIIVPFIVSLSFDAASLLALVFNQVTCVFVTDDIAQVPVVPISLLGMLLQGFSDSRMSPDLPRGMG